MIEMRNCRLRVHLLVDNVGLFLVQAAQIVKPILVVFRTNRFGKCTRMSSGGVDNAINSLIRVKVSDINKVAPCLGRICYAME